MHPTVRPNAKRSLPLPLVPKASLPHEARVVGEELLLLLKPQHPVADHHLPCLLTTVIVAELPSLNCTERSFQASKLPKVNLSLGRLIIGPGLSSVYAVSSSYSRLHPVPLLYLGNHCRVVMTSNYDADFKSKTCALSAACIA
ncbi:hypothetical protein KC354_g32 [Hortaea werneckii]|nr:hypothetical protein KC354_g32 [Hortaea werneckii]